MAIRKLRCPNCAASLNPSPGACQVVCDYCKTTSLIEGRGTPSPAYSPEGSAPPDYSDMPVASYTTPTALYVFIALSVVVPFGIAVAVFVESVSHSEPETIAEPPPISEPPPPPRAAYADLQDKLNPVVGQCMNRFGNAIADSYKSYVAWAGSGEVPRTRRIRGVRALRDGHDACSTIASESSSKPPADPAFEKAAVDFAAALKELHPLVQTASSYYERERYRDDRFAQGRELHGPLLKAFSEAIDTADVLQAEVNRLFDSLTKQMKPALEAEADRKALVEFEALMLARQIALMASSISWREISQLDEEKYTPLVHAYEAAYDELKALEGSASRVLHGVGDDFLSQARALLHLKMGTRQFSRSPRSLDAVPTWEQGTPEAVVDYYNRLAYRSRTSPVLTFPRLLPEPAARPSASSKASPPAARAPRRPALPETPDRSAVVAAVNGLDVSHCAGTGMVFFTLVVAPDGSTSLGRRRFEVYERRDGRLVTSSRTHPCIRAAILALRFPKSQRGLEVSNLELVVPGPMSELPRTRVQQWDWQNRCPDCG